MRQTQHEFLFNWNSFHIARDRPSLDTSSGSALHTTTTPSSQSIVEIQKQQQQQQNTHVNHIHHSQSSETEVPYVCPALPSAHKAISAFRVCPQVIPMQETLELRLKESTYPSAAAANWSYKMEGRLIKAEQSEDNSGDLFGDCTDPANDGNSEEDDSTHRHQRSYSGNAILLSQPANNYATTSQASQHLRFLIISPLGISNHHNSNRLSL